ncbi:Uncharacterised protein [Vibrio cholerae]|nr:Uncharacterised protein [Vibrio cholerae]CSD25904.1 Uncharacterised protein [Vibrio cholerae]
MSGDDSHWENKTVQFARSISSQALLRSYSVAEVSSSQGSKVSKTVGRCFCASCSVMSISFKSAYTCATQASTEEWDRKDGRRFRRDNSCCQRGK